MNPLQSVITWKREVPQPHVLIFFLISSSFSISSTISRGKVLRGDPKKSLFRYMESLVFKYQIWHSWAMIILWVFFLNNVFFIFSILFSFLLFFVIFVIFIFFDWQQWATVHFPMERSKSNVHKKLLRCPGCHMNLHTFNLR